MSERRKEQTSLLVGFIRCRVLFRLIDFLLERRLQDFTPHDLAEQGGFAPMSVYNAMKIANHFKLLKVTRKVKKSVYYQLNDEEPLVRAVMAVEMALIKQEADKVEMEALDAAEAQQKAEVAAAVQTLPVEAAPTANP